MQDIKKTWDVKSLLSWSQQYFISKGINQPKLSSELLLADALNFTRMQIYLNFEHIPEEKELAKFKEYILKRLEHMPIQYILKKAFFRNLELYVDENVLIPRPETELLVDRVLSIMSDIVREKVAGLGGFSPTDMPDISLNILEIGTGSGAIALSLIKEARLFIAKSLAGAGKNGPSKIENRDNETAGSHLVESISYVGPSAKPDGHKSEGAKSGSHKSEDFGPDGFKPEDPRAGSVKPEGAGSNGFQSEDPRSGSVKPENAGPNGFKSEDTRAGSVKPENAGPDGFKPEDPRAGSVKPEGAGPNGFQSEDPRSGVLKSFNDLQATEIASLIKLKITATEKSRAALEVALKNAKSLLSKDEMKDADFIEADILPSEDSAFVSGSGGRINERQGNRGELKGKINIVVSNPPYISEKNYGSLPKEVCDFEPKCALFAGDNGLEIYKKILKEASGLFAGASSFFVFEIDPNVSRDLQKFISESMAADPAKGSAAIEIYKDYNQRDRIMVVRCSLI